MSSEINKLIVSKTQKILRDKGYDVKTSHLYDLFSQLAGYKNWHVASSQNANLALAIDKAIATVPEKFTQKAIKKSMARFLKENGEVVKFSFQNKGLANLNYLITGIDEQKKLTILFDGLDKLSKDSDFFVLTSKDTGKYRELINQYRGSYFDFKKLPKINIFKLKKGEGSISLEGKEIILKKIKIKNNGYFDEVSLKIILNDFIKSNMDEFDEEIFKNNFNERFSSDKSNIYLDSEIADLLNQNLEPNEAKISEIYNIILKIGLTKYFPSAIELKIKKIISDVFKDKEPKILKIINNFCESFPDWEFKAEKNDFVKSVLNCPYLDLFDTETDFLIKNNFNCVDFSGLNRLEDYVLGSLYFYLIDKEFFLKLKESKSKDRVLIRDGVFYFMHRNEENHLNDFVLTSIRDGRYRNILKIFNGISLETFFINPSDFAKSLGSCLNSWIITGLKNQKLALDLAYNGFASEDNCKKLVEMEKDMYFYVTWDNKGEFLKREES